MPRNATLTHYATFTLEDKLIGRQMHRSGSQQSFLEDPPSFRQRKVAEVFSNSGALVMPSRMSRYASSLDLTVDNDSSRIREDLSITAYKL